MYVLPSHFCSRLLFVNFIWIIFLSYQRPSLTSLGPNLNFIKRFRLRNKGNDYYVTTSSASSTEQWNVSFYHKDPQCHYISSDSRRAALGVAEWTFVVGSLAAKSYISSLILGVPCIFFPPCSQTSGKFISEWYCLIHSYLDFSVPFNRAFQMCLSNAPLKRASQTCLSKVPLKPARIHSGGEFSFSTIYARNTNPGTPASASSWRYSGYTTP